MLLHYKFSDANVSLVHNYIPRYTLPIRKYNNYKCKATIYISYDAGLTVNHERLQACNCIYYHNVSRLKLTNTCIAISVFLLEAMV